MNKWLISLCCILCIGTLPATAHASIKKKVKDTVEQSLLEEFAAELAKLPGLKQLTEQIHNNEYRLVTKSAYPSKLEILDANDASSMTIGPSHSAQGIKLNSSATLKPGTYWIKAYPKDSNKHPIVRKIYVSNAGINEVELHFWDKGLSKYPLEIITFPQQAKVRILNIGPKYAYAMQLKPGKYRVEVSHKGYQKRIVNIVLNHNQTRFPINLKRL